MDQGVWQAMVHWIAKSWIWLKQLSTMKTPQLYDTLQSSKTPRMWKVQKWGIEKTKFSCWITHIIKQNHYSYWLWRICLDYLLRKVMWGNWELVKGALGVGDRQGSLACCSPWGRKELDTIERLNWTELRALCLVYGWLPSCSVLTGQKKKKKSPNSSLFLYLEGLNLLMGVPPSWPHQNLIIHYIQIQAHWELRLQHINRGTNIQSITSVNSSFLLCRNAYLKVPVNHYCSLGGSYLWV